MGLPHHDNPEVIRFARWTARGLSLLINGFILILFVLNEDFRNSPTPPAVVYLLLALSTLIAWRWERAGGLLTLFLAPVFLLAVIIEWSGMEGLMTPIWQLALIGVSMMLPFLIIGWLFVSVGRQEQRSIGSAADGQPGATRDKPIWTIVIILLLGLLVIILFVMPFLFPIQQQFEFPEGQPLSVNDAQLIEEPVGQGDEVDQSGVPIEQAPVPSTQIQGGAKTGIAQVDSAIDTILINDLGARQALVRLASAGCTMADGLGSIPKCEEGRAEGTPIEFLPLGGPGEGSSVSAAEIGSVLDFETEALYSAYVVAEDLPDDPTYPHGKYALIFSTSGNGSDGKSVLLRVDDEGYIVRLDSLGTFPVDIYLQQKTADLIDPSPQTEMFNSEAAKILVYPPDTVLPAGSFPQSIKGYTLQSYTWDGQWIFTLTVGLNSVQPCSGQDAAIAQDIPSYTMKGIDALKAVLDKLQPGEYVTWCSSNRPDAGVIEDIIAYSEQIDIHLDG